MIDKVLENIGLTKGEIKVYLALLELGNTTTGKIITHSRLSSGKIYEILDKLIDKGLATFIIKEKTKHFQATNPKKILEYHDKKKKELNLQEKEINLILPEIVERYETTKDKNQTIVYNGIQGLRTALFDTLNSLEKDDEWLAMGVRGNRAENVTIVWKQWLKARIKGKIKSKMILANKESYETWKKTKFTEFRLLPLTSTAPFTVSGNTVLIYNWQDISVVKIENKVIADSFREFYLSLWKVAKIPKK
jgi:HTH-type transcriptional regulator, sugar sensing transcriptional regulator